MTENIGIIPNVDRDKNLEYTKSLVKFIKEFEKVSSDVYEIFLPVELSEYKIENVIYADFYDIIDKTKFIITLGGDGTILTIAHKAAEKFLPILGINLGNIGYMTELDKNDKEGIKKVLLGDYFVESRMMIKAKVFDEKGEFLWESDALNDFAISNGTISKMLNITFWKDNMKINTINSDGIVLSTPTGCTAYSFSAGGPIIDPSLENFCLTPICSHSFLSKPIIFSAESEISFEVNNLENRQAFLTADGNRNFEIKKGYKIRCEKSQISTRLIRIYKNTFFDVLRKKMGEKRI